MISKKDFCNIVKKLREYEKKCDKVNNAMEDLFGEYSFIGYDLPHIRIIFDLLNNIFNINDNLIEDWFYGADNIIIEQDGVKYNITDKAASLYDYLIKTYKEKK